MRDNAERLAAENGLEIEFIRRTKSLRKEEKVQQILRQHGVHPGLVCIFSAMEPCGSYRHVLQRARVPTTIFMMNFALLRRFLEWNWGRRMPFKRRNLASRQDRGNQADAAKIREASGLPVICVVAGRWPSRSARRWMPGYCDRLHRAGAAGNP